MQHGFHLRRQRRWPVNFLLLSTSPLTFFAACVIDLHGRPFPKGRLRRRPSKTGSKGEGRTPSRSASWCSGSCTFASAPSWRFTCIGYPSITSCGHRRLRQRGQVEAYDKSTPHQACCSDEDLRPPSSVSDLTESARTHRAIEVRFVLFPCILVVFARSVIWWFGWRSLRR